MKKGITKKDLENGMKRVNLTLSISEFDDLHLVSEYKKINFTTLACSYVVQAARDEAKRIRKEGYIPEAQRGGNLFDGKGKKRK